MAAVGKAVGKGVWVTAPWRVSGERQHVECQIRGTRRRPTVLVGAMPSRRAGD